MDGIVKFKNANRSFLISSNIWMFTKIKEIFMWRHLIIGLALKDLKIRYRQTTGGFLWMLVMPLFQLLPFILFNFIFKLEIKNYPLLLLSGIFPWNFFRISINDASSSILGNANLVKNNYFPREVLPISSIIINLIHFVLSLVMVCIFSSFNRVSLFPNLMWLPLIIFIQLIFIVGLSLILAGINTVYRDAQFILTIIFMIWFTATPIVYSFEMVKNLLPQSLLFLYKANPLTGIICAYQSIFFYGCIPNLQLLFLSFLTAILFFILGFLSFHYYEDKFLDII